MSGGRVAKGSSDERPLILERHANARGDRRIRTSARAQKVTRVTSLRAIGSLCLTTTARSGARSRCRSRSGSYCSGSPRCARPTSSLRERQPWKAAYQQDHAWLGNAITKHYHGDDNDVKVLMGGIIRAFAGMTVEEYGEAAGAFLEGRHPTIDRDFRDCGYLPMIELLRYLEDNGFTNYIASGGDRDFMRPITEEVYGIPSEHVIGSSNALTYQEDQNGGSVVYLGQPDVFDDGPTKPVRIWSRIGRRPVLAGGNSNGDIPMLHYAGGQPGPALRLLVLHDDPDREFDYTAGAPVGSSTNCFSCPTVTMPRCGILV